MTIEFDISVDARTGQRRTNLHPHPSGESDSYEINQSAGMIKITIKKAASSLVKLTTEQGDFLDEDLTQVRNGQLSVSFHKVETVTDGSRERVALSGELYLDVKKVIHRREEKFRFKVTIVR